MKKITTSIKNNWSLAFLAFLCLAFMAAELINHRFWLSDFEVYYRAAVRLVQGAPLYHVYYEDAYYISLISFGTIALLVVLYLVRVRKVM